MIHLTIPHSPFAAAPASSIDYPLRKIAPLDDSEAMMSSSQNTGTASGLLNLKLENMPSTGSVPPSVSVNNLFGSLSNQSSLPGSAAAALAIQQHAAKLSYEKIGADAAAMAAAAAARVEQREQPQLLSSSIVNAMERSQLAEMMATRASTMPGTNLFGTVPSNPGMLANPAALMNLKQQLSQMRGMSGQGNASPTLPHSNHLQQAVNVQMQFKNAVQQPAGGYGGQGFVAVHPVALQGGQRGNAGQQAAQILNQHPIALQQQAQQQQQQQQGKGQGKRSMGD